MMSNEDAMVTFNLRKGNEILIHEWIYIILHFSKIFFFILRGTIIKTKICANFRMRNWTRTDGPRKSLLKIIDEREKNEAEEEIFLDVDPDYFNAILNWLKLVLTNIINNFLSLTYIQDTTSCARTVWIQNFCGMLGWRWVWLIGTPRSRALLDSAMDGLW